MVFVHIKTPATEIPKAIIVANAREITFPCVVLQMHPGSLEKPLIGQDIFFSPF